MHIDARSLPLKEVHTDVCIIGAGPAGLGLARELLGHHLQVALLESGDFEPDAQLQSLADGPTFGDIKPSVEVNRRQFGGNANVWNVDLGAGITGLRHAIFDEIDFEPRDGMPYSGWPFRRQDLMPYYLRAQQLCQAGPFSYEPGPWESEQAQRLPLEGTGLETGLFQFSASQVFLAQHRRELVGSGNITVYTCANVVELITQARGDRVIGARVARPGREPFVVSARVFIVAAGGFENARLLLASNQQQENGLGNQHDLVGRYYHDHLQGRSGYLTPTEPELFNRTALYDRRRVNDCPVMAYLRPTRALMAQEQLLNINCFLFPKPDQRQTLAIDSFNALRWRHLNPDALVAANPPPREGTLGHVLNVVRGLDYVLKMAYLASIGEQSTAYGLGHGGWSELSDISARFTRYEIWHSMEQSPERDNRVTLSRERDMFGSPKLEVHWRWSSDDRQRTVRAQDLMAREMARAGLGSVAFERDATGMPHLDRPVGSHHLMGTTRMHADPKQGVVDADCRVHGIDNLFIAGSSTFPTGGYANPTMTLIALALRLADLLKQELAPDYSPVVSSGSRVSSQSSPAYA